MTVFLNQQKSNKYFFKGLISSRNVVPEYQEVIDTGKPMDHWRALGFAMSLAIALTRSCKGGHLFRVEDDRRL
ncbi:MAG: hypothetical protein F6K16_36400 [Symploca sp. SIO2B6]|nr:hypothetical protein [Symploca sp. SIO2B6]